MFLKFLFLFSVFLKCCCGQLDVETMGPWGPEARQLVKDLSARLIEASGDQKAGNYLCQRISLAIQRVGEKCTSQGLPGVCKDIYQCEPAIRSVRMDGFHKLTRCGFLGMSEIVCCLEEGKEEDTFPDRFATDDIAEHPAPATSTSPQWSIVAKLPTTDPDAKRPQSTTRRLPPTSVHSTRRTTTTTTAKPMRRAEIECAKILERFDPPLESYIINGAEVGLGDIPYMSAIGYKNENDPVEDTKIRFLCGGTLISDRYVLTAGHCIHKAKLRNTSPVVVKLGVVNLGNSSSDDSNYEIETVIVHPEFNSRQISNDIGLVKLKKRVPFSDTLHPGCLFTKYEVPPNLPLIVTGYGVTDYKTREFSEILLKTTLSYVPLDKCRESYSDSRNQRIAENMLCAGDSGGSDACQGDSGGPLQALTEKDGHYRIIGITSFGKLCGTKSPGVYTRVASHLDWIEAVVWADDVNSTINKI